MDNLNLTGIWTSSLSYSLMQLCIHAGSLPLPWSIRMKIALGAAKGLAFLHEEAERPVIYRDFKTSNILLDAVQFILRREYCSSFLMLFIFLINVISGIQCQTF